MNLKVNVWRKNGKCTTVTKMSFCKGRVTVTDSAS